MCDAYAYNINVMRIWSVLFMCFCIVLSVWCMLYLWYIYDFLVMCAFYVLHVFVAICTVGKILNPIHMFITLGEYPSYFLSVVTKHLTLFSF